jgi:septum formation protein
MAEIFDLVLASASPRRRELLGYFGLPFRSVATDAEEQEHAPDAIVALLPPIAVPVHDHPTLRAWRKAHAVAEHLRASVIIAADTIVVLDGDVLNKPENAEHAHTMLRRLSGRDHLVYTGLAVLDMRGQKNELLLDLVASRVHVAELTDQQIAAYVATGEPLDKAGAYGIQGLGGQLVQAVVGSYTNVVGLPVVDLHQLLMRAGVVGLTDPHVVYQHWLSDQGKEALACPPTLP